MVDSRHDAVRHGQAVVSALFGPPDARPFRVCYWDGTTDSAATPDPAFALLVNRPGALRRMLLPPNELSVVEAYLSRDIDVEGSLEVAVMLSDAISERIKSPRTITGVIRHLLSLPSDDGAENVSLARSEHTVGHQGRRHEKARDRAAIQYHYDVGNDFYSLWLDERMVYSCAYFESPSDSLEDAQLAKLDHVCQKLRLQPGETLLDVGCGWGALIMRAAECYGANALGITLSQSQAALARERIAAAGLADRCRVEILDYREIPAGRTFDKIASVGMIEHVGVDHLPVYFDSLYRALAPGGLLLNHGIVNATARERSLRERLARRLWKRDAFIDQYVFPDGKLGPLHAVIAAAEASGFETRDAESLREHYALTLREWIRRLTANETAATALTNERTYRTWRLYMSGSAHGFATGRLNVVQTLLAKMDGGGRVGVGLRRVV